MAQWCLAVAGMTDMCVTMDDIAVQGYATVGLLARGAVTITGRVAESLGTDSNRWEKIEKDANV